jgi:hypothetical protein
VISTGGVALDAASAAALGRRLSELLQEGQADAAHSLLAPVLGQRTPFRLLDRVGAALGETSLPATNGFLEHVAAGRTEGGWVIIGSALGPQLDREAAGALERCRTYIVAADIWYGADILGERVPGPALLADFDGALAPLDPWRTDPNRWVRRAVGVAAHYWAKRLRGRPDSIAQAKTLLSFLEPMFEEWEMDAVKGIGWGLKTLGRYYPHLLADWLPAQLSRRHRALMLAKAITYLPAAHRASVAQKQRLRGSP